jgi:hypothetical protein
MKPEFKKWADSVDAYAARRVLSGKSVPTKEELRDIADTRSGGELDCTQLDILCDMIDRRIAKWLKEPEEEKLTVRVSPRIKRAIESPLISKEDRSAVLRIVNKGGYTHEQGVRLWAIVEAVEAKEPAQ